MTSQAAVGAPPSPWTAKHRLMLGVMLALGIAGLIAGYVGTSGTLRVSRQVAWINVAGAALLVSGAGVLLFLTAARREIGRRRLSLFGDVGDVDLSESGSVSASSAIATTDLVAAATMTRYHRGDCSFVDGKSVKAASAADHQQAGRRPCGVCLGGEQ
jgi:hypothetical protein